MPKFIARKPLTVPEELRPKVREELFKEAGAKIIELMLSEPELAAGATIHVEESVEFIGGDDVSKMGIPVIELRVNLDGRGNSYLLESAPKQPSPAGQTIS